MITQAYLHECFDYDWQASDWPVWKVRPDHHFASPEQARAWNQTYAGRRVLGEVRRGGQDHIIKLADERHPLRWLIMQYVLGDEWVKAQKEKGIRIMRRDPNSYAYSTLDPLKERVRRNPDPVSRKETPLPTPQYLRESIYYSPDSGRLTWKQRPESHFKTKALARRWNSAYAGSELTTYKLGDLDYIRLDKRNIRKAHAIGCIQRGNWPNSAMSLDATYRWHTMLVDGQRAVLRAPDTRTPPNHTRVRPSLTTEYLRECLSYDPDTGLLEWKKRPDNHFSSVARARSWNRKKAGTQIVAATHTGTHTLYLDPRSKAIYPLRDVIPLLMGENPDDYELPNGFSYVWKNFRRKDA